MAVTMVEKHVYVLSNWMDLQVTINHYADSILADGLYFSSVTQNAGFPATLAPNKPTPPSHKKSIVR